MTICSNILATATVVVTLGTSAVAQGFQVVTDETRFVQLVDGRQLTRLGIQLNVSPNGGIQGRAFGMKVTGSWTWQGNYFCREMSYGASSLPMHCQEVLLSGDTIRFVADQGTGDSADLRLR